MSLAPITKILDKRCKQSSNAVFKTAIISAFLVLVTTGCSTTQEFKPTASVIVGAHKSL